ncbi:hypothetical protein TNCV_1791081 [Trichonephila clavipes]|nr:hypothetical protein TNCV_1791081 [Trichonephila clavipes]
MVIDEDTVLSRWGYVKDDASVYSFSPVDFWWHRVVARRSNFIGRGIKCKRTSKSPNKGKAKKAKPSEEVIALSNSFSAIAHLEVDVKDLNEDNVVDTAPGTEEKIASPRHL